MNNMRRKHVAFPSRQREIHPTKSTIFPAPNTERKRPFVCPTAGGLVDHDRHMLPGCWRADLIRQGRQVMKPTGLDWIKTGMFHHFSQENSGETYHVFAKKARKNMFEVSGSPVVERRHCRPKRFPI